MMLIIALAKPSANADCLVTMAIDAKIADKKTTTTVAMITAVIVTIEDDDIAKTCWLDNCNDHISILE